MFSLFCLDDISNVKSEEIKTVHYLIQYFHRIYSNVLAMEMNAITQINNLNILNCPLKSFLLLGIMFFEIQLNPY